VSEIFVTKKLLKSGDLFCDTLCTEMVYLCTDSQPSVREYQAWHKKTDPDKCSITVISITDIVIFDMPYAK